MNKKLPDIYNIRRVLEDCIEEKLKGNETIKYFDLPYKPRSERKGRLWEY